MGLNHKTFLLRGEDVPISKLFLTAMNSNHDNRLMQYAKIYAKKQINGLNYVDFNTECNVIVLSSPEHKTHHFPTCFLLHKKHLNKSINTIQRDAQNLKKFLDYLLIWKVDILDCNDLLLLLRGFVDYLQLIQKWKPKSRAIEWSLLKKVPLHEGALTFNKIISFKRSKQTFTGKVAFGEYYGGEIKNIIGTVVEYLHFIGTRTEKYKNLDLNQLPIKLFTRSNTFLSSTLGAVTQSTYSVMGILTYAGINELDCTSNIEPLSEEVFTEEELNWFMCSIPNVNIHDRLLFTILQWFGLRRGAASNLMIDSTTLPQDLYLMDYNDARTNIKERLRGDIQFEQGPNLWACYIVRRNTMSLRYDSRIKSKNYQIPLVFPHSQEKFLDLLTEYLIERQVVMKEAKKKHDFLFISNANNSMGEPIGGGTIYSKFQKIVKNSKFKEQLSKFSPHTFRHFFATYLIRVQKEKIEDVSSWLGHSDTEITRKIYVHYLPNPSHRKHPSFVREMVDHFHE
ncbi:site-specific integrase [Bacillus thuringiensis]|uniref:tyrosine-type recombinase/integrase n=1 Tax=Bacillus thuringiensis TaxID=1428 RepID=UPI0028531182|nr:site-specific integrase [Bacillus thuringiensis]MDR4920290.1 site-specific integrase [Bacillus thuringiensis]